MRKKTGAFFTAEAAMVLPMVLGVIVMIIYLLFFQYDRCLSEQDMGALSLYGATVDAKDNEERIRLLVARRNELYENKYIAWTGGEVNMKLEKGKVLVDRSGELLFPFAGGNRWVGRDIWDISVRYENTVLSPASMIRKWRKLIGGE